MTVSEGSALHVVKLGGSLATAGGLDGWLESLLACPRRIVVVTGGGRFADAVRDAQGQLGFDDATAHHLALMAMEQLARVVVARDPSFQLAGTVDAIQAAITAGRIPVWTPLPLVPGAADIEESWLVTSDSLAAWLAARLGATRLWLVKSRLPTCGGSLRALVADGLVDPALPRYLAEASRLRLLGPDDAARLPAAVGGDPTVGIAIDDETGQAA